MTSRKVLFVHFTPPGIIGGVEHIMREHQRLLEERGYQVHYIAGRPGDGVDAITVLPEIDAARPDSVEIEQQLAAGNVTDAFRLRCERVLRELRGRIAGYDAIIVHNAFTLHFSMALTVALWQLALEDGAPGMVAWCHDLSWTNPLYLPEMHEGWPWSLLRERAPGVRYVAISEERRDQLCALWETDRSVVDVVPNGIDPIRFLGLSPGVAGIAQRHRLLEREVVLLLPVRITRRKNIQMAIAITHALRARGLDACFVVSGPEAPHHPGRSASYLAELKALRHDLDMEDDVVFLADELGETPPLAIVSELFTIADALLFTSEQEGFGLPILEAGLRRVPVVLSDLAIFREVGDGDAALFGLDSPADKVATLVLERLDNPASRLFRRVIREYRWEAIADSKLVPLIRSAEAGFSREVHA